MNRTETDNLALKILRASSTYASREEAIQTLIRELGRLPFMNAAAFVSVDQNCHVTPLNPSTRCSELDELLTNRSADELKELFGVDPGEQSGAPRYAYQELMITDISPGPSARRLTAVIYFILEEAGQKVYLVLTSRSPHAFVRPYVDRVRFIFEISKKVLSTHAPLFDDRALASNAEMAKAEFSFRRLFEDLEVPIVLLAADLRVILANKAFFRLHESQPEDLVGATINELLHPLDEASQSLIDAAADLQSYAKGLLQRTMLIIPRRSPPKVVVANLTKIDSLVGYSQVWVAVLQDFDEEFEGLRQSAYYTDKLRSALGTAPIEIFLTTPAGVVLEMEGALQSFKDILSSSPDHRDNLQDTLQTLGMGRAIWRKVLEGTPQSFAVEWQSLRFRIWLSLVQGHETHKSFHVAGVVADVTSAKVAEEILFIRERAIHEVRVLSEYALKELDEAHWQSLVDSAKIYVNDLVRSERLRLGKNPLLQVEMESILKLFISQIVQVGEVRRRTLESKEELEVLTYVNPILDIFNRRRLLESVERDGFDTLGADLDFTLVELPNIEQLRDVLGVQLKDQLLLSALRKAKNVLGDCFRIYSLTPSELMIVAKTKKGNHEKIANALHAIGMPCQVSDVSASIKYNFSTLQINDFEPTEFSRLYNQLLELLVSETHASMIGGLSERQSSIKWTSAMKSLTERVTAKSLVHRAEVAFDVATRKIRLVELVTPIRELAKLSINDPSPVAALLCSGMYSSIEAAEVAAILELGQHLQFLENIGLCINVAPASLLDGSARSAFSVNRLTIPNSVKFVLDISERHLMRYEIGEVSRAVHHSKRLGIQVALDEVGRGFSSFQLLQEARFSYIKISKELYKTQIGQSHGRELASHLAKLSKEIGVTPIATGVSSSEDSLGLRRLGITVQQGPYITKLLFENEAIEARELPILLKYRFADDLHLN